MTGLFSSGLYQRMRGLAISGAPFEMKGDLVKLWDNEKGAGGWGGVGWGGANPDMGGCTEGRARCQVRSENRVNSLLAHFQH